MDNPTLNTIFRIKSHGGGGHYLTVTGNMPLANNRPLYLTTAMSSNMQYWKVISSGNAYKIVSCADENFALNYYWINGYGNSGPCDVYPHISNTDAYVQFVEQGHYTTIVYRIKQADSRLASAPLYLTPSSYDNGSPVTWETNEGGDVVQYWLFEPVSNPDTPDIPDTPTTRTVIDLPSGRTYNWNQFYTGVTSALNGSTYGCAWTCGLDIANIYGPNAYAPSDMAFAWGSGGYGWDVPNGCVAVFNKNPIEYSSNSEYCSKIRSEINNNRPVVVKMCTNSNPNDTHFVVAYGYTGNGDTTESIKVFDPAQSRSNTSTMAGRDTTLANAISWSSKDKVSGLIQVITDR